MSAEHQSQDSHNQHPLAKNLTWHNEERDLPRRMDFVCACDARLGPFDIVELVYLRRRAGCDAIWTVETDDLRYRETLAKTRKKRPLPGDVVRRCLQFSAASAGTKAEAALSLLEIYIRSCHGYRWPNGFLKSGLVDRAACEKLIGDLEAEFAQNARRARKFENAPIVVAARELGLNPRPSGEGSIHWRANCPGTGHTIMIGADSNEFGCGYCRGKGGPDDLRDFVVKRWQAKANLEDKYGDPESRKYYEEKARFAAACGGWNND